MNLILVFPEDISSSDGIVRLEGRQREHVLDVHRATVGDEMAVGLLNNRIGIGRVTRLDQAVLEMSINLVREPPPPIPVMLVLALPRPKFLRRILRTISSMGVKRIVLVNSVRVEKSYWQSPFLKEENIRDQLVLGLEQAKDTMLPEVLLRPLFKPFVEDELPALMKGTLPLVAHPTASRPCPRDIQKPVTLAIGPEGGFIPYEVEKLVDRGFQPVSMGERILSVEAAVPALLSRLF